MHKLGLIGGTSWHSTIEYYRHINQKVNDHFGDNTNPPLLVYTINQSQIHQFQIENDWDGVAALLIEAAEALEKAGAEKLMFCANTPHKVYSIVRDNINTSILHIAEATALEIKKKGVEKVCFFGTKYSMEQDFITKKIGEFGVEVHPPLDQQTIDELHRIIQKELTYGTIVSSSKTYVLNVIQELVQEKGIEGVVLGCTEFPLMIEPDDLSIPIFNTTSIHAQAGVDFILGL